MAKAKPKREPEEPIFEEPKLTKAYVCSCGFQDPNPLKFGSHIALGNRKDGKGKHISKGLVDLETGEVIMPPVKDRTLEQKTQVEEASRQKRKAAKEAAREKGGPPPGKMPGATQFTPVISKANQIQFIPRVMVVDFSPIMRAAYDCARTQWGWDMDFGDFLDTWLYNTYKEHGVTLNSYSIEETEEQRLTREAALKKNGDGDGAEDEEEEQEVTASGG